MLRSATRDALVLLGYCAISFAYFGWRLLPHPGRDLIGSKQDPLIFVWSFAWWPHAIGSGTNPFVTHALFSPEGINLAWTTSVPGLALAFAPLTLAFGPAVSYNIAALLLPALAAWTAYLLCRHLTGSTWASLVGGYLFGFSSYMLGHQLQGHLNLTGVFLVPLVALVLVRYVEGGLDRPGLAWRLGVLLVLQLSISTEVALTLTIALVLGLAVALWRMRDLRGRLRSALLPIAGGYAIAALLAAPLLVFVVLGTPSKSFVGAEVSSTDLLNLLIPTKLNGVGGSSFHSLTKNFNTTEAALFLGLPTLIIVALFVWRDRRSRGAQVLGIALLGSLLLALGTVVRADGRELFTLPWTVIRHVPVLENARLTRFGVYATLAAAVIVALWTATAKGRIYPRPLVLPVLAVAALVPAFTKPLFLKHPQRVAFFTDGGYASCLARGERVAIFPYGFAGDSMLWQAESGFRFKLAGGYMYPLVFGGPAVTSFDDDPTVRAMNFSSDRARPTIGNLLGFAARHRVDRIIAATTAEYPTAAQLRRIGSVERTGGVLVAPRCNERTLAAHDLSAYRRAAAEQARSGATTFYCLDSYFYELSSDLEPAGVLTGAKKALFVEGAGLTCALPRGYKRHGFATPEQGMPAHTYPYYAP